MSSNYITEPRQPELDIRLPDGYYTDPIDEQLRREVEAERRIKDMDPILDWLHEECTGLTAFKGTHWTVIQRGIKANREVIQTVREDDLFALMFLAEDPLIIRACRDELRERFTNDMEV